MSSSPIKKVSASDAKNNFGGLLDDVASLGCVEIVRHGRPVAVVLSPRIFNAQRASEPASREADAWGKTHMIPAELARAATVVRPSRGFDEN